jgi:hypothetical protein
MIIGSDGSSSDSSDEDAVWEIVQETSAVTVDLDTIQIPLGKTQHVAVKKEKKKGIKKRDRFVAIINFL